MVKYTKIFSLNKKIKMEKAYWVISGKCRKLKNPETSNTFEKTLFLSIICNNCENSDKKIFKEEESIKILRILD